MTSTRMYLTNEQGDRIGVLLDLEEYQQLASLATSDPEVLVGLSEAELQALAQSSLAPAEQVRLNDLLSRHADTQLTDEEQVELDRLLDHVDQLTILKTRSRYTLAHRAGVLHAP